MPKIFLTFDDGPGPKTVEIAEELNKAGIKATFFMTGVNVKAMPGAVKRVAELGHEIGVHAYYHKALKGLTPKETLTEIRKTAYQIATITGQPPRVFRAAYGALSPISLEVLKRTKLKHVDWSHDTLDWKKAEEGKTLNGKKIAQNIKAGDVVLFHDGAMGRQAGQAGQRGINILRALPAIIEGSRQKGFEFEPVEKQFQKGQRLKYKIRTIGKYAKARLDGLKNKIRRRK